MATTMNRKLIALTLVCFTLCFLTLATYLFTYDNAQVPSHTDYRNDTDNPTNDSSKLHIVLPATERNVNLCKTLITTAFLGYPVPQLVAWNKTFDNEGGLLGGGSHFAKITETLQFLQSLNGSFDDDLVLMMDAYDIWFQLRPEVLISRYHGIVSAANDRLRTRMGRALHQEGLEEVIVFGAASPLSDDIYGANTDTIMGRNKHTSLKQRYLNSGYAIGPVREMRRVFERAQQKYEDTDDHIEWDNGSHGSDFFYHGSDQSIFNTIFGEQEFQREVMRRRHRTADDKKENKAPAPPPTHIEGTIIDDPLDPSFTHEPMEHRTGKPDEFGITLDYFSQLGQQTVNCEEDSQWLWYNANLTEQTSDRHQIFDCQSRVTDRLPADILASNIPFHSRTPSYKDNIDRGWEEVPLFTNLCLDSIPVMIHHNGDKGAREYAWPKLWLQPHAKGMINGLSGDEVLKSHKQSKSQDHIADAFVSNAFLAWDDLCPAEMHAELFRDMPF